MDLSGMLLNLDVLRSKMTSAKKESPGSEKERCPCKIEAATHDFCSCSPSVPGLKPIRSTRSEMFVEILGAVKKRSTCDRSQVSALIVKENRIISMGYGGSPSGLPHCIDVGCLIGSNGGCIRTIHAESNSIAFAARHGISVEGADLWVSLSPCLDCAKLIINSGIINIYYLEQYRSRDGIELLISAGIKVYHYANSKVEKITC